MHIFTFLKKINPFFVTALFIGILSIFSLINYGLPPTHDGEYHVIRFYEFYNTFISGSLFPLWAADLNYKYGSPLFNYVYPFPNYISVIIHFMGFNFIDAFKINLILASILGAVFAFIYGKYKFGKWGGVLMSASYTFAPYHLLDIYVRGSVGEVWALSFFPLYLYFFDVSIDKKNIKYSFLASLALFFVIISHNILSLMFFAFIILYGVFIWLIKLRRKKLLILTIFPPVFSIFLSAFFVFPALLEKEFVIGLNTFNVLDHFPEIYQLIIPSWGSGYSGIFSGTQMSFQIGLINLTVLLFIFWAIFNKFGTKYNRIYIGFFTIILFITVFLITSYSNFVWEIIPIMQYFQFPWRLLSIIILCVSILAGSIAVFYKNKLIYILFICLFIITTFSYARPPYFLQRNDNYYLKNENYIYSTNSIGNAFQTRWLQKKYSLPKSRAFLKLNDKNINPKSFSTTYQKYEIYSSNRDKLIINTAYFPGWMVKINGRTFEADNINGQIMVNIPKGLSVVEIYLADTKVRILSKTITLFSFIFLFYLLFKKSDTIKL